MRNTPKFSRTSPKQVAIAGGVSGHNLAVGSGGV